MLGKDCLGLASHEENVRETRRPVDENDDISVAVRGLEGQRAGDVRGDVRMHVQVLVSIGISASVRARSRELGQLVGRAPLGWVASSEGPLAERDASGCRGLGEGIDSLTLCVSEAE
eukprot:6808947-Pyramimonas_sp.AAC.1